MASLGLIREGFGAPHREIAELRHPKTKEGEAKRSSRARISRDPVLPITPYLKV